MIRRSYDQKSKIASNDLYEWPPNIYIEFEDMKDFINDFLKSKGHRKSKKNFFFRLRRENNTKKEEKSDINLTPKRKINKAVMILSI